MNKLKNSGYKQFEIIQAQKDIIGLGEYPVIRLNLKVEEEFGTTNKSINIFLNDNNPSSWCSVTNEYLGTSKLRVKEVIGLKGIAKFYEKNGYPNAVGWSYYVKPPKLPEASEVEVDD